VVISGWATVGTGFALMAVHYLAGSDGDPEGWYSAAGFAAPFVGAGYLALVGDRFATPLLCVAGGVALALMSVVSIIVVPLIVPAGFMIAAIRNASIRGGDLVVPAVLPPAWSPHSRCWCFTRIRSRGRVPMAVDRAATS
jgi:hypothetical protein